jgi:hypothetical protein
MKLLFPTINKAFFILYIMVCSCKETFAQEQQNGFWEQVRYDVLYDNERSVYADPWAPFVRFFF